MALLDLSHFAPMMGSLQGKRIGFLRMSGNAGDRLIDDAAEQLFEAFDIEYGTLNWEPGDPGLTGDADTVLEWVDLIAVSGGGNLGSLYPTCRQQRLRYLEFGKPVIVLPQSITDLDEDLSTYEAVYLREQASLAAWPSGKLAPDLALALTPPRVDALRDHGTGVFLREDQEALFHETTLSLGDPIEFCDTPLDYLRLAGRFRHLVTDRLHFAIAGMLVGAKVDLLPNGYHKNRSMHETWLEALGCGWRENLEGLSETQPSLSDDMIHALSAPPARRVDRNAIPTVNSSWKLKRQEDGTAQLQRGDSEILALNNTAVAIHELSDGTRKLGEIMRATEQRFQADRLTVARGVQLALSHFLRQDVIALDSDSQPVPTAGARATRPRYVRAHELHVYPAVSFEGRVRRSAFVHLAQGGGRVLWFETDERHRHLLTGRADPFVLACLMRAMRDHSALIVRGAPVSAGLIENLHHFQEVWASWYGPHEVVPILPEHVESSRQTAPSAICGFSGGVDSTYTVYRHLLAPHQPWAMPLRAAVIVRGFDIYVGNRRSFGGAADRARRQLERLDLELIELNTNIREIYARWSRFHGLATGAALTLFSEGYSHGLIASTAPYAITYPWGSNPLTDPLMSSDRFKLIHDGANTGRLQKLQAMRDWDTAIKDLRFCYLARQPERNCGVCEKCVTTAIQLRVLDMRMDCFEQPPSDDTIIECLEGMQLGPLEYFDLLAIRHHVLANGLSFPWFSALESRIDKGQATDDCRDNK